MKNVLYTLTYKFWLYAFTVNVYRRSNVVSVFLPAMANPLLVTSNVVVPRSMANVLKLT